MVKTHIATSEIVTDTDTEMHVVTKIMIVGVIFIAILGMFGIFTLAETLICEALWLGMSLGSNIVSVVEGDNG